jgi:hypothetical protein
MPTAIACLCAAAGDTQANPTFALAQYAQPDPPPVTPVSHPDCQAAAVAAGIAAVNSITHGSGSRSREQTAAGAWEPVATSCIRFSTWRGVSVACLH